jgi:hypothetical protein
LKPNGWIFFCNCIPRNECHQWKYSLVHRTCWNTSLFQSCLWNKWYCTVMYLEA